MLPGARAYPPPSTEGYWGISTSTIDWCEENYVVSHYIAEALNTVTNSIFIVLAAYAMYGAYVNKLEKRFILIGAGFALVGFGSWMFHMTLLYKYQLLDELPMIYATCIPFWSLFSQDSTKAQSVKLAIFTIVGALGFTGWYLILRDPTLHQIGYAVLNLLIVVRSYKLTNTKVTDLKTRHAMNKAMLMGSISFITGYFLWLIDIHACSILTLTKHRWGIPYGFVLEGHAWWHLFTGTGVYYYVVYLEYLRILLLDKEDVYEFTWRVGIIPEVITRSSEEQKRLKEKTK